TPTQLTFNAAQQASFGGERFQVFEVEVPARTPFRIDAESNVDDSSVYADTYVMRGGRWREHYLSDGEQFDVATRVRIVVDPGCDDRDSGAMVFTCGSFARPGFVVGALADVSADVPFLGSGSLDVQPLQAVAFHFTVDHETDAMLVGTDGNGSSAYLTLGEPGVLRNDDGSYHFVPGDYTAAYSNRTADVVNVTVSFVEVQVVNVQKPSNISLDSPSTTFDLVAGQEMRLSAYVPTGESVVIRARPDGDQDIVLTVSSSRGEICGELDRGNAGGRGSSEQCRFTVSTGGNFGVVLAGVHPSDLTGTVTVTITRS
ncbi:MAG: hypothetical protein JWM12_358, partial [Ilumatobacteraceae bacterium]|nr:hypothetical protein [Ilumatobacteraceae bacterium]